MKYGGALGQSRLLRQQWEVEREENLARDR